MRPVEGEEGIVGAADDQLEDARVGRVLGGLRVGVDADAVGLTGGEEDVQGGGWRRLGLGVVGVGSGAGEGWQGKEGGDREAEEEEEEEGGRGEEETQRGR